MEDLKNKIEAILFSVGKKISVEKISSLCGEKDKKVIEDCLFLIKKDYDEKKSPMMLIQEGPEWKITVRESYLPLVRNIVTDTELSKPITETLAIIAFKYPISQADLVKIRSNKAYDHIKELEQMQFVEKVKRGRTFDIKLTQKFFEYFDLPEKKVKEQFSDYAEIEKVIEEKEEDYEKNRKEIEARNKELQEKLKAKQASEEDYMKELDEMTPDVPENIPDSDNKDESGLSGPEIEDEIDEPVISTRRKKKEDGAEK